MSTKTLVLDKQLGLELGIECQRPEVLKCGYREYGTCVALTTYKLFTCEKIDILSQQQPSSFEEEGEWKKRRGFKFRHGRFGTEIVYTTRRRR